MRIKSRITFHMKPDEAEKILIPIGQKVNRDDTLQLAILFNDTEQFISLINMLENNAIRYNKLEESVYSKKEFDAAELLYVIPNVYCGYPKPDNDGTYKEFSYNISTGCSKCSCGMVQDRPLRILKPKMGSNDITALHWVYEFIITANLRNVIEEENLTGCEFWPVVNHIKNVEYEEVFQLYISNRMPPMSSKTNFILETNYKCICGRIGTIVKGQKVYEKSTLGEIQDFNRTYECLGGGYSGTQVPIVSKRVYDVFQKYKIKGVRFEPVEIV